MKNPRGAASPASSAQPVDVTSRNRSLWWSAVISLAVLTIITAIISYEHAYEVFRAAHNAGLLAILGPVVPDLVIAVSSIALLAAARAGMPRPGLAVAALTAFIGVTMALNVAAGLRYGRGSALLAVLAPAGYLVGLDILARMMAGGRDGSRAAADLTADDSGPRCPHTVSATLEDAIWSAWEHARNCAGEPVSYTQLGDAFRVDRRKVSDLITARTPATADGTLTAALNGGGGDA